MLTSREAHFLSCIIFLSATGMRRKQLRARATYARAMLHPVLDFLASSFFVQVAGSP